MSEKPKLDKDVLEKSEKAKSTLNDISQGIERMLNDIHEVRNKQDEHSKQIEILTKHLNDVTDEVNKHSDMIAKGAPKIGSTGETQTGEGDLIDVLVKEGIDYLKNRKSGNSSSMKGLEGLTGLVQQFRTISDALNPPSEIDNMLLWAGRRGFWRYQAKQAGLSQAEIDEGDKLIDSNSGLKADQLPDRNQRGEKT